MTDPKPSEQQLKDLQEKVRIFSLENEILAERAEDTTLLGLVAEKISLLEDPKAVIETGLEQISLLKDIPVCACCSIVDGRLQVDSSFVSFAETAVKDVSLILPKDFALSRALLLTGDALDAARASIVLPEQHYKPDVLLLLPFENFRRLRGVFLFAADDRLVHCQALLMRITEMLINRVSTICLLRELHEAKEELDRKVDERTRELSVAYRGLEREMAERMAAQEALRESEEQYRSLFEESQDIVFIATYYSGFIDINPAGISRFGYASKEAFLNLPVRALYADPADLEHYLHLLNRDGFVMDFKTVMLRSDGEKLHVSINATAVRDDQGNMAVIRGIMRDITEHRKLEDQLRQAQKMESIGTLAGGIAHDFNNILTAIIGYAHLTIRKMAADDPNRLNIEQILEASDRAAHLTKDLLLFSRKQAIDRKLVDLNSVIRRLEKFLVRVIGEDISFHTTLYEADLPILADAHQIEQILMNLATNARDAMPRGGALTIATEQIRLNEQFVRLYGYCRPGMYVLLTISDTGQGMDHETAERIFEPFFTTKEVGRGTGLGLAVVYGIVRQHEGHINVYSEPGTGTTFRIYLPLVAADRDAEKAPAVEEHSAGGIETILLAEDNETVRDLTASILREFGYTVLTAVDGEDAVSRYRENAGNIQMLLFDLIMPGKSGKEAYDEIRKMRPDIKILFASGYSPDIVRDKASLGNGVAIMFKPVSPMELLKKVRSVLDKGRS